MTQSSQASSSRINVTVVRVQDANGRGPWQRGFSDVWCRKADDSFATLPTFLDQFPGILRKLTPGMHCGCGCRTVEQLRRWFDPIEYDTLKRYGFRSVRLLAARIVAESDVQLVFERGVPLRTGVEEFNLY